MGAHTITSVQQLRTLYPPPAQRSVQKEIDHLDRHCLDFIARSPFLIMSTSSGDGHCEASPRGGPPGFVRVLDERRLLIPDATGNRRLDSLENLLDNPHVGLLFLLPGMGETLRINGRVELTTDPELIEDAQTGGRPAVLGLIVHVRTAYLHCAKCIIRSQLWCPEAWGLAGDLPSAAEVLSDHIGIGDVAASAAALQDSYTNRI